MSPVKKSATKRASRDQGGGEPKAKSAAPAVAEAIDKQLARYQAMRDFAVTREPSGKQTPGATTFGKDGALPFIIQKHAATRLHYDFRLGWNGVLKSWAVTKGPSFYPGDRRLAVEVEDHPIAYGGFEGIIPKGQYGGGAVMLWDEGTWEPQPGHTDVTAGLRDGSLKFVLHGSKLQGRWTLVRMGGKAVHESKPNWLLIKEHDEFERAKDAPCITEEQPDSVVTQRSLDQIAAQEDHVWNSKDTAKTDGKAWFRQTGQQARQQAGEQNGQTEPAKARRNPKHADASSQPLAKMLDGLDAPKEALPPFVPPQLATQATRPPEGQGWLHELKLDGYRLQARLQNRKVELLTRTGLDWTHRMPFIAAGVAALPAATALLDGEVVVLGEDGNTSFADLQAAFQEKGSKQTGKPLTYFVFDLLHLDGCNLRGLLLTDRKALLQELLNAANDNLRLSEHLETNAGEMFAKACALGAEGIIAKRADAPYRSERSATWLKLKCIREQEFVVGGFTLPAKGHTGMQGIGSLLLGYYDERKQLVYAGRTGTGFTQKTHASLRAQLEKLRRDKAAFAAAPAEARRGAIWTEPKLVAQVRFATWTSEGLLRQASFQGLREDKPAAEVRREESLPDASPDASRQKPTKRSKAASPAIPPAAAASASSNSTLPPGIRLTHPAKVVDYATGLTKQQLADYLWAVAPHMLPHMAGRPLSLVRCPEGSTSPCFFQKHTTAMLPPGIDSILVPDKKTGKPEPYITLSTPEALAALAQMGVLEVHPWGSRNEDLEHPDRLIFDLDPDPDLPWPVVAAAAVEVRKRLKRLGLESFLKLTGGKGLHVVVPIDPAADWTAVKQWTHAFVLALEKEEPELYLSKMTKAARKGRIYLDYLRNERGATAVAAYSPRARAGAPVSLPLAWAELKLAQRPAFTVADFANWNNRLRRNPWKNIFTVHQKLPLPTGS